MRVSVFVRDRADARLLALDDSLRRRPLHAGEESCHGAFASYPHAISRRLAVAGSLPRLGRRGPAVATGAREGWSVLHQHARRPAPGAAHSAAPAQGHEADRDDHRRQAFGADPGRRANLQERLRPRSAGREPDARRSVEVQARRRDDQHIHAGVATTAWCSSCRRSQRCAAARRTSPRPIRSASIC